MLRPHPAEKLSAGAKRDLDNFFSALARFFITDDMDDETRFHRWSALIWTALIFIEDACNTCPEYTARQKKLALPPANRDDACREALADRGGSR